MKSKGVQCVSAVVQSSGLPLSTYFSSVKLKWLLQNVTAIRESTDLGECLAGTVDSWLIWVRFFSFPKQNVTMMHCCTLVKFTTFIKNWVCLVLWCPSIPFL